VLFAEIVHFLSANGMATARRVNIIHQTETLYYLLLWTGKEHRTAPVSSTG